MRIPLREPQAARLREVAAKHGLSHLADRFLSLAQPCVQLAGPEPDRGGRVGACRLGGLPDVPAGFRWPEGMAHLAQLDLSELAGVDAAGLLPGSGMLYFFLGDDERAGDLPVRVVYADVAASMLRRADPPDGYVGVRSPEYEGGDPDVVYDLYALTAATAISLPSYGSRFWNDLWGDDPDEEATDAYFAMVEQLSIPLPSRKTGRHQLFGYPMAVDRDPAALACLTRHGIDPDFFWLDLARADELVRELEAKQGRSGHDEYLLEKRRRQLAELRRLSPRLEELRREVNDWVLLLELDSDLNAGICFWDAGHLHFMVHKDDLAALRFDRVFASLFTT